MSEFDGKVVLITGGTRGIGQACVERFAGEGARVALCGRFAETAESVAKEVAQAAGAEVIGLEADVSNPEAVRTMVNTVTDSFGPVDILVNNAGITRDGFLARMKDDEWDAVLNTNLAGVFYCCRAVSRDMLTKRYGRIINISSVVGLHGQAGQVNYASAKAGLIGLSKSLAHEFASRNVTVNVIAPGYIETAMTAKLPEKIQAAILERIPVGRAGLPADVAGLVRFLASDESSYLTGAVIQVDGGLAM